MKGLGAVGNRAWMRNGLSANDSELYGYDALHGLTSFDRGDVNTNDEELIGPTNRAGLTRYTRWTLDRVGNWTIHELGRLLADATHQDRREDRAHNNANEIAMWTGAAWPPGSGAPEPLTVSYSHAGDLNTHGLVGDPATQVYAYEADGNLSRVSRLVPGGETGIIEPIAEYVHDALERRVRMTAWHLHWSNHKCCARSMVNRGQLDLPS